MMFSNTTLCKVSFKSHVTTKCSRSRLKQTDKVKAPLLGMIMHRSGDTDTTKLVVYIVILSMPYGTDSYLFMSLFSIPYQIKLERLRKES